MPPPVPTRRPTKPQPSPAKPPPAPTARPTKPQPRPAKPSQRGLAHLKRCDPVLTELIEQVGPLGNPRDGRPEDNYGTLLRAIVGQQLSTKAARSIFARLTDRFDGRPPTPEEVLADDPEELRLAAGLSRPKVGYLRSLAEHVLSGELELERLEELNDETVIAELVAVKGLGIWTAQMFLMFQLERPDVLPVGDLGIRKAIGRAYELDELPQAEQMEAIAEPWRPHRTLACRYLWRSLDNEP